MRVALVTTSFPSFPGDACGHFVHAEALELRDGGHEVHVLAPLSRPRGPSLESAGLTLWPLPHAGAFGWPGAASRLASRPWRGAGAAAFVALARSRLRALAPDRVVAHWLLPSAWPIALALPRGASLEAVAHGGDVRMLVALPSPVRARIVRALLERGVALRFAARSLLHALSAALAEPERSALASCAFVRAPALRVPDVTARAAELRRPGAGAGSGSGSGSGATLACAVGRLVASKRVDLAIDAARALGGSMRLQIVGDGPEQGRLRALGLGADVAFSGWVERERALAWIAAADVLVHPSALEAAPSVVREARALGTPVVACDAGDVALWARTDPGIVVVAPTARAIARGVGRVVGGR
jgi:glycosyltransferase involved in cell wall biosynthesis